MGVRLFLLSGAALFVLILTAIVAGLLCTLISWRLQWLTAAAAVLAGLYGASLIALGGWPWIVPALLFFTSSSALSGVADGTRSHRSGEKRNVVQVLANGGVPWLMLAGYAMVPHPLWYWGFVGATAAATSDTWATEVGQLSTASPRHILTGQPTAAGTSGAVSAFGLVAAAAGALLIGISAALLWPFRASITAVIVITLAGFLASVVDSVLGATVQARYRTPAGTVIEQQREETVLAEGWPIITNDSVNALGTLSGSVIAVFFALLS